MFVFVESVETEHVGDAFGLGDRPSRGENRDDGAADFNAFCSSKRLEGKLRKIGAQPHLALPVGHHGLSVRFLRLRGEVGLRNPARSLRALLPVKAALFKEAVFPSGALGICGSSAAFPTVVRKV